MNSSETISVTREDVDRLYDLAFSRRMEKSAQWKETGIGALGGAGLGAILSLVTPKDNDESRGGRILRYLLGGAAMGGLAGLGYGASKDVFRPQQTDQNGKPAEEPRELTDLQAAPEPEPFEESLPKKVDKFNQTLGDIMGSRAVGAVGGAAVGAGGGELASAGLHTLGDRVVDPLKSFSLNTMAKDIERPVGEWDPLFRSKVNETAQRAFEQSRMTAKETTELRGLLRKAHPTAADAERIKTLSAKAVEGNRSGAGALTRWFRPRLSDKAIESSGKVGVTPVDLAKKYKVSKLDLRRSGMGRKFMRAGGGILGAIMGAALNGGNYDEPQGR